MSFRAFCLCRSKIKKCFTYSQKLSYFEIINTTPRKLVLKKIKNQSKIFGINKHGLCYPLNGKSCGLQQICLLVLVTCEKDFGFS
ncbi:hypothetical protein Glove_283g121 [Diversispora epigaea]|uniref:Uncharacterized protein n=1 Tax=Diversispora epigaea TaxID=1348612 RepID=A0A397I2X5_9GLOM|nr:hypothetical protein Glove_283g121 [Diversispora epigaea]